MQQEETGYGVLAPDLREYLCVGTGREEVQRTSEISAARDV